MAGAVVAVAALAELQGLSAVGPGAVQQRAAVRRRGIRANGEPRSSRLLVWPSATSPVRLSRSSRGRRCHGWADGC